MIKKELSLVASCIGPNGGSFQLSKQERTRLGDGLVMLSVDVDNGCLRFFTPDEWERTLSTEIAGLPGRERQEAKRTLSAMTWDVRIDKQGRVSIPSGLSEIILNKSS